MKKLFHYIFSYIKENFDTLNCGYSLLIAVILIYINYYIWPIETTIEQYHNTWKAFAGYWGFYSLVYFVVAIPILYRSQSSVLMNPQFWLKPGLFLGIFSYETAYLNMDMLMRFAGTQAEKYFIYMIANNTSRLLYYTIPLLLVWWCMGDRKDNSGVYGIRWNIKVELNPFWNMLLIMIPLIAWASFQSDFLENYPTYKVWNYPEAFSLSRTSMVLIYEIFYGMDFLLVEWLVRGALIIGLYKIMGKTVLLPVTVFYCTIHFGKPMAEAISSILGGYVLGIFVIRTSTIYGGFLIHAGIAWLMEIAAFIQHILRTNGN